MAIRTISHLSSLLALRSEVILTLDRVQAHPMTQGYVLLFQGLRDEWTVIFAEELDLRDRISAASASVFACNVTLNILAGFLSKALLRLFGDDRTHPGYIAFFRKKTLTAFRRPVMGPKLVSMRGWIEPLAKSNIPALVELGLEIEAAVAAADIALADQQALAAQMKFFRETGNRKKLFDKVNGARKVSHGELGKMPHEKMGLPPSFADLFFRHGSGSKKRGKVATIMSLGEDLERLARETAEKTEQRAVLVAEAKKEAEAERAVKEAAIAALQKEADEAAMVVAAAQAKIAELSRSI